MCEKEFERKYRIDSWKAALRQMRILLVDERNCQHEYSKRAIIEKVLQIAAKYFKGLVFIKTTEPFHDVLARPRLDKEPRLMWVNPNLKGI